MNKDKKLSQDEVKMANTAKRFIRQASVATKDLKMFGESHPVLQHAIQNSLELLKTIMTGRDSVTLTFAEGLYLVEDVPLKDIDLKTYSLIKSLKECDITSLTFSSQMREDELRGLMKIISDGPGAIKSGGGVNNVLLNNNIQNIKADETFFKKISKKEEEDSKAKSQLADILIVNYLLGKASAGKGDVDSLVTEIGSDPKRVGGIISNMAYSAQGADSPGGVDGEDGVDRARSSIERIAGLMKNSGNVPGPEIKADVGKLVLSLDPSLRNEVLKSDLKLPGESQDLTKDVIAGFSEEIIADLITSEYIDRKISIADTRKFIQRLLPSCSKRDAILPIIENRLTQKGASQEDIDKLLHEKFWIDMNNEEKLAAIRKKDGSYCIEIGIAHGIKDLVQELLDKNDTAAIDIVIGKVLDNIAYGDKASKLRLLKDFEKIFDLLYRSKDYSDKEKLFGIIKAEYEKLKDADTKRLLTKIFMPSIRFSVENNLYKDMVSFMNTFGYANIKDDAFSGVGIDKLINDILTRSAAERDIVVGLAKEIGEDAKFALCNILLSIEDDDFDSYRRRQNIIGILKELKWDCEDIFVKDLCSEKSERIKNCLETLAEVGTARSAKDVEALLSHHDTKIQSCAKVTLKKIEKRLKIIS